MPIYAIYCGDSGHHYGNYDAGSEDEALDDFLDEHLPMWSYRSIEEAARQERCGSVEEYRQSFRVTVFEEEEIDDPEFEAVAVRVFTDGSGYAHGLIKSGSYHGQWYAYFSSLRYDGYETRIRAGYLEYWNHHFENHGDHDEWIVDSIKKESSSGGALSQVCLSPELDGGFGERIVDSHLDEIRVAIREFIEDNGIKSEEVEEEDEDEYEYM